MRVGSPNVWLVTSGEPIESLDPDARPLRAGLLARSLLDDGCKVTWWSSRFDHFTKSYRQGPTDASPRNGLTVRLIDSPGYFGNWSPRRIVDHVYLGAGLFRAARVAARPDVIVASFPPIELAAAAVRLGRQFGVPTVVDVRDLWPDVFLTMTGPKRALGAIAALAYDPLARWTLRNANALTSITEPMLHWALTKARRERGEQDAAFPLAYSAEQPTRHEVEAATDFWRQNGVVEGGLSFCYSGSLNTQVDLEGLIEAHRRVQQTGLNSNLVVCGTGALTHRLRAIVQTSNRVVAPGWVGKAQLWVLLRLCRAGIVPYHRRFDFELSIPNKVIEYFSAGLPVISTLQGPTCVLLAEHGSGITVPYGDSDQLAAAMLRIGRSGDEFRMMSDAGRGAFRKSLAAERVYPRMSRHILQFVEGREECAHAREVAGTQ